MTPNQDIKRTLLFDIEYHRNNERQTYGYYRPLIESDI